MEEYVHLIYFGDFSDVRVSSSRANLGASGSSMQFAEHLRFHPVFFGDPRRNVRAHRFVERKLDEGFGDRRRVSS